MQKYFDSKIPDIDALTSEYYQSGSEVVKDSLSINDNLNYKCENIYKRRIP
jgi:hypothetical protein